MLNPYSAEDRTQHMVASAFRATRSHFSHLPLRDIINPPVDQLDAKLARQVAIHILNTEFEIPRRRIWAVLGMARANIILAIRKVDERLTEPMFEKAYQRIAARAKDIYMSEMYADASEEAA
ncbi:hypothetical protein IFT84_10140 [Rhizobium sp. CFBP 8762]|uniref:hypothetical protein n=1 Tax=Rhizobium sp. CFBP 8762 TaxID=2775279 RepID=UPI001781D1D6|nr:hypothetical protein [Rhizobium sp. CFBP 8762]MBD8554883.1 hypothetical protein [Rhizobium sp. CFBP 8762]